MQMPRMGILVPPNLSRLSAPPPSMQAEKASQRTWSRPSHLAAKPKIALSSHGERRHHTCPDCLAWRFCPQQTYGWSEFSSKSSPSSPRRGDLPAKSEGGLGSLSPRPEACHEHQDCSLTLAFLPGRCLRVRHPLHVAGRRQSPSSKQSSARVSHEDPTQLTLRTTRLRDEEGKNRRRASRKTRPGALSPAAVKHLQQIYGCPALLNMMGRVTWSGRYGAS